VGHSVIATVFVSVYAIRPSETVVTTFKATRSHKPDYHIGHFYCREKLKSHTDIRCSRHLKYKSGTSFKSDTLETRPEQDQRTFRTTGCLSYYSAWLQSGRLGFDHRQIQRIVPLASASTPFMRPTQPPNQWVLVVKRGQGLTLTTHPHLVPRSGMSRSCTLSPPCRPHGGSGTILPKHLYKPSNVFVLWHNFKVLAQNIKKIIYYNYRSSHYNGYGCL
jgi:hypothetical protein